MATTRFYLDTRVKSSASLFPLKLAINHKSRTAMLTTDIRLSDVQWDPCKDKVVLHPKKSQFNLYITTFKRQVDSVIESLSTKDMSASDIKKRVEQALDPEEEEEENAVDRTTRFAYRFLQFAHSKSKSTCGVYMQTYRRMVAFMGEDALNEMQFEDVTKNWLVSFENFMAETAGKNARNIHLRNIRAVVNDAIDDEITSTYAFRRFKIRPEATKKRSLPVEKLRMLFNFQPEAYAQKYLDMFKLIFMLIGINVADLANLKRIEDGRIEYRRKKTHRLYSVKVEPEALELIDRLAGENWLVYIRDKYNDHNEYTRRINRELKKLGEVKRSGLGGKKTRKPLFPELTTYWARHSWATIAASLDIPKDVIAHALGHGGNTVTDIYIDFDQSKVDEANRKVLDWVLYGKK